MKDLEMDFPAGAVDQNVVMIRSHLDNIPDAPLPEGYGFRGIERGDISLWADIWRDADPDIRIADDLFLKEFGDDWDTISWRCLLLVAPDGNAVGTISAWYDTNFRCTGDAGRIHWVAIRSQWQGGGLAKPMMTGAMNILAQHHHRAYLVTQAFRLPAIRLYLGYGFEPDLVDDRDTRLWRQVATQSSHPALESLR
jgi:GNAT superfamily N-acetyltransferase